jgi:acyl-coenzyme A synthetase/AMP-(fatty) acid ligase
LPSAPASTRAITRHSKQRFGVPLIEAWAMTETGAGAWITANRDPRHPGQRCFGRAPIGLDVCASWMNTAPMQSAGHGGRIAGETRRRTNRAADSSAATTRTMPLPPSEAWRDGWFHSGDLVRTDIDGSFFFVDRSKTSCAEAARISPPSKWRARC